MHGIYIAIDPGKEGGVAWAIPSPSPDYAGPLLGWFKMPEGRAEIQRSIRQLIERDGRGHAVVWLEQTGTARPGQDASSTATFARGCGFLEGVLTTLADCLPDTRLIEKQVPPKEWQKKFGSFSHDKPKRKKQIKEAAAARFPGSPVTYATADALGMLAVMLDKERPGFI